MNIEKNKKVFILGSTGSIGEFLCYNFAVNSEELILHGRDEIKLSSLADKVLQLNPKIKLRIVSCDLGSIGDVQNMLEEIDSNTRKIDILINAAAIFNVDEFFNESNQHTIRAMNINLISPMLISKRLAKGMKKNRWGRIINITSVSAYQGKENTVTYCSSKHGLLGFSRALHLELRDYGVRVISVAPGSIQNKMGSSVPNQDFSTFIDPEELAKLIYDLVQHNSNLVVDELRINRMKYN